MFQNKLPDFYEMEIGKSNSDVSKAIMLLQKIFQCIQSQKNLEIILKEIGQMLFGQAMHPVIEQLLGKAEKKAIVKIKDLYIMMKHMLLFNDDSRIGYEAREDVVNLLTVHDAKGKEFSLVIVYAIEDFKDEPEEKRLLYVAMTRAKDTLFLLESIYNTCEILPYFEKSVTVYIGGKNLC